MCIKMPKNHEKVPEKVLVYRKGEVKDELDYKYGMEKKSNGSSSNESRNAVSKKSSAAPAKPHYVSLYSTEGQLKCEMRLPGRNLCKCQAARHRLVNNCVHCGRIICAQEGSGPCLFCGNLVCTPEEEEVLRRGGKTSQDLKMRLMGGTSAQTNGLSSLSASGVDWEKAVEAKNRLLDYDRTSAQRTSVIDDQSDYYSLTNPWLTDSERKRVRKLEEARRKPRLRSSAPQTLTFDFAGRHVLQTAEDPLTFENGGLLNDLEDLSVQPSCSAGDRSLDPHSVANPSVPLSLTWSSEANSSSGNADDGHEGAGGLMGDHQSAGSRIQDTMHQEFTDEGKCLSMHQPYASLLIKGIKRHEGRSWYTSHRGVLWIASAAKVPTAEDIKCLEELYRSIYPSKRLEFPDNYPPGTLLGCVDVTDCLPQEQYRETYPNGESESPYVWICENFRELPLKFPMAGQHKIYKLDPQIHQAAKKAIFRTIRTS